jgi:hypothetical protein
MGTSIPRVRPTHTRKDLHPNPILLGVLRVLAVHYWFLFESCRDLPKLPDMPIL